MAKRGGGCSSSSTTDLKLPALVKQPGQRRPSTAHASLGFASAGGSPMAAAAAAAAQEEEQEQQEEEEVGRRRFSQMSRAKSAAELRGSATPMAGPEVTATSSFSGKNSFRQRPRSPTNKEAKEVMLKFSPGDHGLTWDDARRVTGVILQAWMRGVRPGWTVLEINGGAIETEEELAKLMLECSTGDMRYEVKFEKCQGNFGTEAKERQDQQRRNRLRVQKLFATLCTIEKIEHRAVTLGQFQTLIDYAQRYCEVWFDASPVKLSKTSGQYLSLSMLNFHHLNDWIIQPATKPKRSAMAEALARRGSIPEWYICHHWGQPVLDFCASWEAHLSRRSLSASDTPCWLAACAVRQHCGLGEVLGPEPRKSGLYRSLEAAGCRMLLVLDPAGNCFSRLWCCFELSLLAEKIDAPTSAGADKNKSGVKAIRLDVAAGCSVLAHGLTPEEQQAEDSDPGTGVKTHIKDEQDFPRHLLLPGLATAWLKTETSSNVDRQRLLNCLLCRGPCASLKQEASLYEESNCRLRAFFASRFWALFVDDGVLDGETTTTIEKLGRALSQHRAGTQLEIDLQGHKGDSLVLLAKSLPAKVKTLSLKLNSSCLEDSELSQFMQLLPKSVKSLEMNLAHAQQLSDEGLKGLAEQVDFEKLHLKLCLTGTQAKKTTLDLLTAQMLKSQAAEESVTRREVAKALNLNLCRAPQETRNFPKQVVQAVPLLAKMLQDEENALRIHAYRALEGWGERVLRELDDPTARAVAELRARKRASSAAPAGTDAQPKDEEEEQEEERDPAQRNVEEMEEEAAEVT